MVKVVQLAVGGLDDNFSYLAVSGSSALIVDPCGDVSKIKAAFLAAGSPKPAYILITHGHRDHVSGLAAVKAFFDAPAVGHPSCSAPCEIRVPDKGRLPFGESSIECLHSPGHSPDSVCYRLLDGSALFTGDTLFIDCCGYCEAGAMFRTMREVLTPLPDSLPVYSGHNYGHVPFESLGAQKRSNPYLMASDFESFKNELKNL